MDKKELFLREQLAWTKERMALYDAMDEKLIEMREIASEAADINLSVPKRKYLQMIMEEKQAELSLLQQKLQSFFH